MTVNEIKQNYLCLEYRQEPKDRDYGSCLWARFLFNLDRYELSISSDCGNYGYKWTETPKAESFLHLMARTDSGYMMDKLYGPADIFDFEETKKAIYKYYNKVEGNADPLDEIFWEMEIQGEPDRAEDFCRIYSDAGGEEPWLFIKYIYPSNALKIIEVFRDHIQPKIREILRGEDKNK